MQYDGQSAHIFPRTDWRALGAVYNPASDLTRWGEALTVWELEALGFSRRAAEGARMRAASQTFEQPHPQFHNCGIICVAWCHADGGWTIGLIEPSGQQSPWVLKGDLGAQLHCACDCRWTPACPGVVSVQEPPTPSPMPSTPTPQPVAQPVSERRGWFGNRRQAEPATVAAPIVAAATTVPTTTLYDQWHDQPAEEYRGSIYADPVPVYADDALPYASSSGADWLAHLNAATAEPEPVPVARAERRSFLGGLLTRREQSAPVVEAPQHYPALAYAQPAETYLPPNYDQPQIIDATDYLDWNDKNPALFDYPEALAAPADVPQLPPPSDDYQLSSQAEIDSFIEVAYAYDTAPDPQPEPEPLALLPAPEGQTNG